MEKLLLDAGVRAGTYRALADCFYPPDEGLARTLRSAAESGGSLISEVAACLPPESDFEALKVEHARLFIGPFKLLAPPFGSVYLETGGALMGESTVDVRRRYREAGLDLALKEVPDHISIELEFMHFLACKEAQAVHDGDASGADACRGKQKAFLSDHLGRWISEFAERIAEHASSGFYRKLGAAIKAFIPSDLKALEAGPAGFIHDSASHACRATEDAAQ